MSKAVNLTDDMFDDTIHNNENVLIDLWAAWCHPCKMMHPVIDEISVINVGEVFVGKMDIEINKNIIEKFKIKSIPTILFFKNGKLVNRHSGSAPVSYMQELIEKYLSV